MKKAIKKMYLSMLLVIVSLLTMVATTFAWVGIVTSSSFEQFSINVQEVDDDNKYGIYLSLDGYNFTDNLSSTDVQAVLLKNYKEMNKYSDVHSYSDITLDQVTTTKNEKTLGRFYTMDGQESHSYLYFDLYVSVYGVGSDTDEANQKLTLYLRDTVLSCDSKASYTVFNTINYPTASADPTYGQILGINNISGSLNPGASVKGKVTVDPSHACRLGMQKFKTVRKGKNAADVASLYETGDDTYLTSLTIYETGNKYPSLSNGTYDFGSVLPKDYNFAYMNYKSIYGDTFDKLENVLPFEKVLNRGDVVYKDDDTTNMIVDADDSCTVGMMTRFRFYLWFEGWDSDCFDAIDKSTVNVNLSLSAKNASESD